MEWIKIDKDNPPTGEVLAANFKKGTYGYKEKMVGTISWDGYSECFLCDYDSVVLENCTHYIDINKFDIQ